MADLNYRKRLGDRKEGRLLRSLPALNYFTPFIMKTRNDATNLFSDSIEIAETDRWLHAKRAEGYKGIGMLHVFIAAYIRTIAMKPGLNRFVSGQRIFARNNIQVIMAVKRGLSAEATETMIKVDFEPTDTLFDVYRKFNAKVDEIKTDDGENNTEKVAGALSKFPRLLLKFTVWLLGVMDYFDWLPKSLLAASPFHGSMIITDLGSLGIPPIYHHIYNFGNLPVFIAFGAKRRAFELDSSGQPVERKYIDLRVVSDERICDGYYYASSLKIMRQFLSHPHLLETPPEKVGQDIF